jgi:hypothetical protein
MRDRLLSAFELASESARGSLSGSRAFIEAAQRDVAARLARLEIPDILPLALIRKPLLIAGALAAAAGSMLLIPDLRYGTRLARAIIPGIDLDRVSRTKIEILAPSPASADVPANEWTAVRVATSGQVANSGSLEWQTPDGAGGAVELRALEERPTSDGVEAVTPRSDTGSWQETASPLGTGSNRSPAPKSSVSSSASHPRPTPDYRKRRRHPKRVTFRCSATAH